MSILPAQAILRKPPLRSRLAFCWRTVRAAYYYANRASHHVLGFTFKLVVLAYFLFAMLFLALRYAVLPNIDVYKPNIEKLASDAIGLPVTIERVYASWNGLRPHLFLGDVEIQDKNGRTALRLPSVSATLSWWSLFSAQLRFSSLELGRPDLDIRRDVDGKVYVAGLFIDPNKGGDGKGADWLLAQREILIREGRLRWTDLRRAAPELVLNDVHLTLRNQWRHHQAGLRATPASKLAEAIDLRADFEHRPFASNISDIRLWKGVLFADLRATDLASWKAYFDYPFELYQGTGSMRAWLDVDHAKLANFTADLRLSNVVARLGKELDALHLRQVNGRIAAHEDFDPKKHSAEPQEPRFGKDGHTISLQDFSLETEDGLKLEAATIDEVFVAANGKHAEQTSLRASALDLRTLSDLASRLPFSQAQRQMLRDFAPRGTIKNFAMQWRGSYPNILSYQVKGRFEGLALAAQVARPARAKQGDMPAQAAIPAIPGFENLTGSIDATEQGGEFDLAAQDFVLQMPGYFDEPNVLFEQLSMRANWDLKDAEQVLVAIEKMEFNLDGIKASISGKHWKPLKAGKGPGKLDLKADIERFPVLKVGRFIPLQASAHLREWLGHALEAGEAKQISLKVQGDLAHFPFHTPASQGQGEFVVRGQLDNVKLNYSPGSLGRDGVSPKWPQAEAIHGTFEVDRGRLEIFAENAKTRGIALNQVKAVIPDLLEKDSTLEIDGTANASLQAFIGYINASPVYEWTGHFTEDSKAEGPAKLALKFKLPLNHAIDTKVQGSLQLMNNELVLLKHAPVLSAVTGKIEFNERGVTLPNINSNFLGGPLVVSGGSQADGSIQIKALGNLSMDGVRRAFNSSGMQNLAAQLQGGARYSALIAVKKRQTEITLESNLLGLAMQFPPPMRKAGADTMPLRFSQLSVASDDGSLRDEIKLSLGNTLFAKYQRQKNNEVGANWRVLRGGIGVNVAAPEPDSGLTINASMRSLNVDAWRSLAANVNANNSGAEAEVGAENQMAQYLDPDVLAARSDELVMLGKKLDNVVVGASHQKGVWQANINSNQASGYITWYEGGVGRGFGKVTSRLSSLVIPESAAAEVSDLLDSKNTTTQIPAIDLVAENFELFNKKLGKLELLANNARSNGQREWRINKLALTNPDAQLQATGKWVNRDGEGLTNLNYSLAMKDAGKMLDRFGFANVLRGGEGKMEGDLNWKGVPFALDIPSLSGQIKLDMAAGQFLKVEPGAAKLLSVLSLQALPKLLKLDFHDVFSEGFAFDGITANANITKGVVRTDNLKMRSVNATVLMDGSADIARETQSMYVVVIPEFNVGTASVVYGLAVNPVVGLGSFLAQLFLRNPMMKAFTFQYQISGSWKEPNIAKVEARAAKPNETSERDGSQPVPQ